jgi:hypothetical protein
MYYEAASLFVALCLLAPKGNLAAKRPLCGELANDSTQKTQELLEYDEWATLDGSTAKLLSGESISAQKSASTFHETPYSRLRLQRVA